MAIRTSNKRRKPKPTSALIIVDVINDLEFPGGEKMLPWAEKMVAPLRRFRERARRAGIPIIYANDNFGLWRSSFEDVYKHCVRPRARGRNIVEKLRPTKYDYFVLKPKHSAFFATSLVPLLESLEVKTLIFAGIATNICVLFSAHDAYMHEYKIAALSDCCAAESDFDHNVALQQLKTFCQAKVCKADEFQI